MMMMMMMPSRCDIYISHVPTVLVALGAVSR